MSQILLYTTFLSGRLDVYIIWLITIIKEVTACSLHYVPEMAGEYREICKKEHFAIATSDLSHVLVLLVHKWTNTNNNNAHIFSLEQYLIGVLFFSQ